MKYVIDNLIKKLNDFINETKNQNFVLNDWIHLVKKHPALIARYDSSHFLLRNILISRAVFYYLLLKMINISFQFCIF